MVEIMFIRHAESENNKADIWSGRDDCNLTQNGINYAKQMKEKLSNIKFDEIYCSPLKRTKQTLNEILPGVEPIYDERIIEIFVGEWEGTQKNLVDMETRKAFRNGEYTPPGGEKYEDVEKRVNNFVSELFKKYKRNEKILVVTHNGVIRVIKKMYKEDSKDLMSKNLEIVKINNKMLNKKFDDKIR